MVDLKTIAEQARRHHYSVATSEDRGISSGDSQHYIRSRALFTAAIAAAYPDDNTDAVMDVWLDCNESVAYCVNIVRREAMAECEGHESLSGAHMGESVYCDGSCVSTDWHNITERRIRSGQ